MRSALIVISIILATPAFAVDDEPIDHLQMGRRLADHEHYLEAIKEFELAYALRQQPILLYEMGKAQQRLGQAEKALDLYRRYLVAAELTKEQRADVDARVRALSPRVAGPVDAENPMTRELAKARYEMVRNKPLMDAGISLLVISYVPAFITASVGLAYGVSYERATLGTLYVPVLGPFVSAGLRPNLGWSLPWTIVDGMAQALGFSMMVAGAMTKKKVLVLEPAVTVLPASLPDGVGLVAFGRF